MDRGAGVAPKVIIEVFLDCHNLLHTRVDDTVLEPEGVELPSAATHGRPWDKPVEFQTMTDFAADIEERLAWHRRGLGEARRWVVHDQRLRDIGLRLGSFLFGRPGMMKEQGERRPGNILDQTLLQFYHAADSQSYISLCFSAHDSRVDSLPWEMTIWRHGARDIVLGTDPNVAFVRQSHYPTYHAPSFAKPSLDPLEVGHATATSHATSALAQGHQAIEEFFDSLGLDESKLQLLAEHSHQWQGEHAFDIFHFYGHGQPGSLYWEGPGLDRENSVKYEFGIEQLLQCVDGQNLPGLIVVLACSSFDPKGWQQRGLLWDLVQAGVASAIGMLGTTYIRTPPYLIQMLYLQLFEHGRVDRAVQRVRWLMRYKGRPGAATHEELIRADWFRPILVVRDRSVLSCFDGLRGQHVQRNESGRRGNAIEHRAITESLELLLPPLQISDHRSNSALLERMREAINCSNKSGVAELQDQADRIRTHLTGLNVDASSLPDGRRGPSDLALIATVLDEERSRTLYKVWDDWQWKAIVHAMKQGMASEEINMILKETSQPEDERRQPVENAYLGPYYYLVEKGQEWSLVAKYDEARGDWYWPYGDSSYTLAPDDVHRRVREIRDEDTVYHKVELSIDFFERNDINVLVPGGKQPVQTISVWSPYGSENTYWEKISLFSAESNIGKAIRTIRDAGTVRNWFDSLARLEQAGHEEGALRYEEICGALMPLLHPDTGDPAIIEAIDNALPRNLPDRSALQEDPVDWAIEGDAEAQNRCRWRWRLFYALASGLARGKLTAQ
ncbi:MAG: CHAT domain-containing protein [Proteobacteria bacterium]|nr:CHAT domain-containing protein [Pseudomonadota bacterium]